MNLLKVFKLLGLLHKSPHRFPLVKWQQVWNYTPNLFFNFCFYIKFLVSLALK